MGAKFIPGEAEHFSGYVPAKRKLLHVTFGSATTADVVVGEIAEYVLVDVTMPVMVFGLWTQIETAFTTSVTATIGDSGALDRYIADTTMAPAASGAVLVAASATFPYLDASGLDIKVNVGGATVAAGLAHVYIEYAELDD